MANEYVIDCDKIEVKDSKYIDQMAQFLKERFNNGDISVNGKIIKLSFKEDAPKKKLKLFANKFLYQAGLKKKYRLVSLIKSDLGEGFQLVEF